jgi:4-hydroxy-tetrahydrodipicolinate reductase
MGRLVRDALAPHERAATFDRSHPPDPGGFTDIDVVIDFSSPGGLRQLLAALPDGVALVSGTTGLGPEDEAALAARAARAPVLHAANFSPGVALLTRLVATAAAAWPAADLEIVEVHHRRKADAPSGTALALARAAALARGASLDEVASYGRHPGGSARRAGEIGIHAVRAGGVFGEHTVLLATDHEVLELRHSAGSRLVFAEGAVAAARWLAGRPPGRYTVADVAGS